VDPVPLLHGYYEVLRRPALPLAALRCLRLAIPSCAPVFVSPARPDAGLGPGAFGCGSPNATLQNGNGRTSQVPGEPCCVYALFSDPGGPTHQATYGTQTRPPHTLRRPTRVNFGAQSHGLDTSCLRFARWVTRTGRKTRFRLLAKLYRVGLATHRVPAKGFRPCIPLSQASWRKRWPVLRNPWPSSIPDASAWDANGCLILPVEGGQPAPLGLCQANPAGYGNTRHMSHCEKVPSCPFIPGRANYLRPVAHPPG